MLHLAAVPLTPVRSVPINVKLTYTGASCLHVLHPYIWAPCCASAVTVPMLSYSYLSVLIVSPAGTLTCNYSNAQLHRSEKAEAAPALLSVADESGLPALRNIALDWLVHNFAAAAATPAFQALSKAQSDMIAAAACSLLDRYQDLLHNLAHVEPLPEPKQA